MSLFQNNQPTGGTPLEQERMRLFSKIRNAQTTLWLIVIFSIVNLVAFSANFYFLFSAKFSLYIVETIYFMKDEFASQGIDAGLLMAVSYVFALFFILPFFIIALLSKKHKGAIVAGLILWSLDTIFCFSLIGEDTSVFVDIAFHVWGIVEMVLALRAYKTLSSLPQEQQDPAPNADPLSKDFLNIQSSDNNENNPQ